MINKFNSSITLIAGQIIPASAHLSPFFITFMTSFFLDGFLYYSLVKSI